jgi:outer membrane protein assembly factor BamA
MRLSVLLALLWAARLPAQIPDSPEPSDTIAPADTMQLADTTRTTGDAQVRTPWKTSYFPYLAGAPNDGPLLAFRLHYFQPAEYDDRVTSNAAFTAEAGITPRGGRQVILRFRAPQLWKNWRLKSLAAAVREVRFGYFGLGNETVEIGDLVTPAQPFLYRVRRARYGGQLDVTRRIRGPWQVALQGNVEWTRFTTLPGPSLFKSDFGPELRETDVSARVALVYDTRDKEYNTHQGLLLEAGAQGGTGGSGYSRLYTVLRGYISPREGAVIAARLAASGIGGGPTLNARYVIPAWEDQIPVLGGQYSHRSFDTGRFAGKGVLFGNLEVRYDLLSLGDLGAITLLGFVDAGRVFEGENFRLTTKDLKVGGGGGIGLRILRSTIFTLNLAGGPDGFNYSLGSGWMF